MNFQDCDLRRDSVLGKIAKGARLTEQELLTFVGDTFRSAWPLELLLLLRQEPRHAWLIADLVRELRASVSTVNEGLAGLRRIGLVVVDQQGAYSLAATTPALEHLATELSELYGLKPRAVTHAILSAPNDRIRTFADAFRIRKDPS